MSAKHRATQPRTPPPAMRPLLTERELLVVLKISRTTLYEWRRRAAFPRPLLLAGARNRWRPERVEEWLRSQEAA